MPTVNMFEAKSNLSSLVEAVATGREAEIVIARNGKPVARIVPLAPKEAGKRLGVAKGKFKMPESIDEANEDIGKLFSGSLK